MSAVREHHAHHEAQQNGSKAEPGDAYDLFEHIRGELDVLSNVLHLLTDHSVSHGRELLQIRLFGTSANKNGMPALSKSIIVLERRHQDVLRIQQYI